MQIQSPSQPSATQPISQPTSDSNLFTLYELNLIEWEFNGNHMEWELMVMKG